MSAKASENRGAREPATWIYVSHKFMRLHGPFFRSRIPFANLPPPTLPHPYPLFIPLMLSFLLRRCIPAFREFFAAPRIPPGCGQFATYYQVKYRGRFVIAAVGTLGRGSSQAIHVLVAVTKTEVVTLQTYHGSSHVLVNVKRQFNTLGASCIIHMNKQTRKMDICISIYIYITFDHLQRILL